MRIDDEGPGAAPGLVDVDVEVVVAQALDAPRLLELLQPDERARVEALRRDRDRARSVSAHALLRVVVAERLAVPTGSVVFGATCRTCGGAHGKPELREPVGTGLHVSLSHAADVVVVGLTSIGPIGVDVEAVAAVGFDGFDDVALTERERAAAAPLRGSDRLAALATTWVRKEAVLKATGHGLVKSPAAIEVSGPSTAPALVHWSGPDAPGPVRLADVEMTDGLVAAVAVLTDVTFGVRIRQGDSLLREG